MTSTRKEMYLSRSIKDLNKASVPFLPGHSVSNLSLTRTNHRRAQNLYFAHGGGATQKIAQSRVPLDKDTLAAMSAGASRAMTAPSGMQRSMSLPRIGNRSAPAKLEKNSYRPAVQPAWLKHDRQCLRFYGYFQEAVTESATENSRIRCVILTHFLEDGTSQITEQKVANSGIWPQGPFVKRHKFPRADGSFLGPGHLKMGISLTIYGHCFRLINADPFTKWFFEEANMDIGEQEEQPLDNFLETQVWKTQGTTRLQGLPADVMAGKEMNEMVQGGGRKSYKFKQFLENDRKVLRFYGYWDDSTRYGSRSYFTIHYFLADDTVEVNCNYMRNVGKWRVPQFMKRQPLELNPQTVPMPGMIKAPSPILLPKDIEVGKTIPVYGREVFIYDCDDATRVFYQKYMGKTFESIEIPEPKYEHTKLLPPPYVYGRTLGSEADTLAGCNQVTEREKPHRDMTKLFMYGNKALRFEAVAENGVPEDAHRKFLIEYFIADDTLLVGDLHVRNSGCWDGGKFKERDLPGGERRTINPDTGRPFEANEFYVGSLVKILCMPMRIIRADEWSLKFMETDAEVYPQSSIQLVAKKLEQLPALAAALPGTMAPEDFRDAVSDRTGVELSDQELITVLRNAAEEETAMVQLDKLCAVIRNPPPPPQRALRPGDPLPEWMLKGTAAA